MKVTPELKDKILNYIIDNSTDMMYRGNWNNIVQAIGVSEAYVDAILTHFDKRGLITYNSTMEGNCFIRINVEAHDYILAGGHVGEIEMMGMEFKKLQKEILSIEMNIPKTKFDYIMTSLNTVLGFFAAVYPK